MMVDNLLRASLDGAIVAVLVWIAITWLPRLSPATRTALWWCVAAKFVLALVWVAPIELQVLPARSSLYDIASRVSDRTVSRISARIAARAATGSAKTDAIESSPALEIQRTAAGSTTPAWPIVLTVLWCLGLAAGAAVDIRRFRRTRAVIRSSAPASDETATLAASLAHSMGLRRAPIVRVSEEVSTPLVTGVLRPQILLPSKGATLSAGEQRMALCHELSHIKRQDLWLGLIPTIAERLFFFHPLVRLAAREYSLCREAACDAAVIETLSASPRDYGRLLLALGVSKPRAGMAVAGAASSHSMLKRRITMLRDSMPSRSRTRLVSALAITAAVAGVVPLRLVARAQAPAPAVEAPKSTPSTSAAAPANFDLHAWAHHVAKMFIGMGPASWAAGSRERGAPAQGNQARQQDLNYVLFIDDHDTNMSGSISDIELARKYRRGNERLLWFRFKGGEYVVRAAGVLDQIDDIWRPVGAVGDAQGALGAKQGLLGAKQGDLGAQQGVLGAQQGTLGAQQGNLGARQGMLAEREERARTDAERQAIRAEQRKIDDEMRGLDEQMRALDLKMREFDEPMRDLDKQMRVLDVEMRALDTKMRAATDRAQNQMRELVERAISSGAAERVR
jgi:beta-lactamase regulating signal transducer with metallopeptidase domain